jgi:hypothetical protein
MSKEHSANWRKSARPPRGGTRGFISLAPLFAIMLMLSSCGGEARLVPPTAKVPSTLPAPSGAGTPVPATAMPAPAIDAIVWAASVDPATQAPSQRVTSFSTDAPGIYACFSATNLNAGAVVEASWTYNKTSLDAFTTRLVLPDAAPQRWIAVHLTRDPNVPWPAGTYAVTVSVNGKTAQQAAVEVAASA